MGIFEIIVKSEEQEDSAEKAQIISRCPGVKALRKNTRDVGEDKAEVVSHVLTGTPTLAMSKSDGEGSSGEGVQKVEGPWQRAVRSNIPGQYRRRVITPEGREKWEYYKTKANKYHGREPEGKGWAQTGEKEHGGYRREVKDTEKEEKPSTKEKEEGKQQVAPGGAAASPKYEYSYPTKEQARAAAKYHGGRLLASKDLNEAMEHLQHLHGAREAHSKMRNAQKSIGFQVLVKDED